jgi:hypothetical protein
MAEENLSSEQLAVIERSLGGAKERPSQKVQRDRLFIEAVLFRFRAGIPWSQLPARFGQASRVRQRFIGWAANHRWKRLLDAFGNSPTVPVPNALHSVIAEEVRIQPIPKQPRKRGFATMSQERRREIARKGGASVAPENRSFSRDRDLAARAGMIGGEVSPPGKRTRESLDPDPKLTSES